MLSDIGLLHTVFYKYITLAFAVCAQCYCMSTPYTASALREILNEGVVERLIEHEAKLSN